MKIPWDGRYIKRITKNNILLKEKSKIGNLCLIDFGTFEMWCYIKKINSDFLCFYDELKPFFGLKKHGTGKIMICNKLYLVVRYMRLKRFRSYDENYKESIRKITLYNNIFGLKSSLRDVYITKKGKLIIFSLKNIEVSPDILSNKFVNNLFNKHLQLEKYIFNNMIGKTFVTSEELSEYIYNISSENCKHISSRKFYEDVIIENLLVYHSRLN